MPTRWNSPLRVNAPALGAVNLHRRVIEDDTGLLLAGLEGSLQYNEGPYQYSQQELLVPWLLVLFPA